MSAIPSMLPEFEIVQFETGMDSRLRGNDNVTFCGQLDSLHPLYISGERPSTCRPNVTRILTLLLIPLLLSCSHTPRTSAIGHWRGDDIKVTDSLTHESVSIPIKKYGYLKVQLKQDSTFVFDIGVLKDVRVEKDVLGVRASTVLIPAVFKSTRYGKYSWQDSTLILNSMDGLIFAKPSSDGDELKLWFADDKNRLWQCRLEYEE